MLTQIAISMLAYAVQLAVVRYVPAGRRRMMWTVLRLIAALSLATIWMLGTWVMRTPAALATKVRAIGSRAAVLARHAGERAARGAGARPARAGSRDAAVAGRRGRRHDLAGRHGRAPRRDGGLGRGGRGLGGGDARAGADVPLADSGDQGPAADRARSFAAAGADRDAGDLHRRADLRRRGLGLDDGQPGPGLVFRVFARAVHGHHRPAHAHAGRAAGLLDPAHGAGAARAACSPQRRAPGPSSSAASRRWCSR